MNITRDEFKKYIKDFAFKGLFNFLGWNFCREHVNPQTVKDKVYDFEVVAEKGGFKILVCKSADGVMPTYSVRAKLDNNIKQRIHEHIIIFCDGAMREQVWLYSYMMANKAKKAEIKYNVNQDPERLYERASGLIFDIDEEDKITIVDVTKRVNQNFATNTEKVTKKFYDGFKKQHTNLLSFMKGITHTCDKEWYASIMLNRLMFCYFMQKRGFLNRDRDYLRNKLAECQTKLGKGNFYSFYRSFLMVLFHKGFGSHIHDNEVVKMIGDIPYLNGGLFEIHEIEQKYHGIDIDDQAFKDIFDLFDKYEWHLDSRDCASGNEISPDVLGYIFEKYINDRAQMGAYYTQEDITEYISRNSIIPFIFNKAQEKYADIFAPHKEIWSLLKNSGDKYIFQSVKKGVELPLPDYIEIGLDTSLPNLLERRNRWNEPAASEYALPTEIWREVVERRQRYNETLAKINAGEITSIQDFITYNLDICTFAQDVIDTIDDSALIKVMYEAISKITVLDPTCGSGAFLFAALNILEPLYNSCLSRMEDFMSNNANLPKMTKRLFEDELEKQSKHPNKAYFVYKSIILNNLYGVDIMAEAAETAKLRLFLKLVSCATPNYNTKNIGIEPLPDIDFNIKCGNTLVGYATEDEVDQALKYDMLSFLMQGEVHENFHKLSMATHRYKELQLRADEDYKSFKETKDTLKLRSQEVNEVLDKTLYEQRHEGTPYEEWLTNAQPFHWISEFYSIISKEDGNGGFDVIIGNPPYVEYNKIKNTYNICNYDTARAGNLYAFIVERSQKLLIKNIGMFGMIIPISSIASDRAIDLQTMIISKTIWTSSYSNRPAKLFQGVEQRLVILILRNIYTVKSFVSSYNHWYAEERQRLFEKLYYTRYDFDKIVKIGNALEKSIITKIVSHGQKVSMVKNLFDKQSDDICYFHDAPTYWIRCMGLNPLEGYESENSNHYKELKCKTKEIKKMFTCILNSTTYYLFFKAMSNCRDFTMREITEFSLNEQCLNTNLNDLYDLLINTYIKTRQIKNRKYASGKILYYEYYPKQAKNVIDKIDLELGKMYDFTEEELDYIINYDIKYRMGVADTEED